MQTTIKSILLWLAIIAAHGCTLASDQEMEQRLTNHWKTMQQEYSHERSL